MCVSLHTLMCSLNQNDVYSHTWCLLTYMMSTHIHDVYSHTWCLLTYSPIDYTSTCAYIVSTYVVSKYIVSTYNVWADMLWVDCWYARTASAQHMCSQSTHTPQYAMGCLRLSGSLKTQVSSAEYRLFDRALSHKRPVILKSLLMVATPYVGALRTLVRTMVPTLRS